MIVLSSLQRESSASETKPTSPFAMPRPSPCFSPQKKKKKKKKKNKTKQNKTQNKLEKSTQIGEKKKEKGKGTNSKTSNQWDTTVRKARPSPSPLGPSSLSSLLFRPRPVLDPPKDNKKPASRRCGKIIDQRGEAKRPRRKKKANRKRKGKCANKEQKNAKGDKTERKGKAFPLLPLALTPPKGKRPKNQETENVLVDLEQ